ncbi:hypothetical protein D3C86_766840 [compost metagenome]
MLPVMSPVVGTVSAYQSYSVVGIAMFGPPGTLGSFCGPPLAPGCSTPVAVSRRRSSTITCSR